MSFKILNFVNIFVYYFLFYFILFLLKNHFLRQVLEFLYFIYKLVVITIIFYFKNKTQEYIQTNMKKCTFPKLHSPFFF